MKHYTLKNYATVQAIQWTGDLKELYPWMESLGGWTPMEVRNNGDLVIKSKGEITKARLKEQDWIIKTETNFFKALTNEEFNAVYQEVT